MRCACWILMVSVFSWLAATGGRAYADYCSAFAYNCGYEHISRVQIGTLDNATGCAYGGYGDYTVLSTAVLVGENYPITVTNGQGYATDECGVWVDWNQDQDFDDAGEGYAMVGSPGPGPYTATVVPPPDAWPGATRMRVRISWNEAPVPCGSTSYGEVEDYTIIVALEARGACCYGTTCTPDMTPDDCAAGGGVFLGIATDCDPNPCSGACCVALVCVGTTNEAECAAQSGTWYVGEDCTTFECPQSYCEAGAEDQDEYISRVQLGTIDNISTFDPTSGGYQDFSYLSTPLDFGVGYQLTVTNGNPYLNDRCGSWVDWNNDGDFDDAGEAITMAGSPGYGPYTGTVQIPGGTAAGGKRLRIRISYNLAPLPCGIAPYGEVEDYTVLVPEPPLTGACCQGQTCMPDMSEADCLAAGGLYRGNGSTCDPNPCSGACCIDETCVATTSAPECFTLGGDWYVGEVCDYFTCPGPDYCTVFSEDPFPYIQRVQFHTIDNTSGFLGAGYQDFTAVSANVDVGADYAITVTASWPYGANLCAAWVDWNRDGDFEDAGEHYELTEGAEPHTGTITVPIGTPPGTKRLRVRLNYGTDPVPCGSMDDGEAEDYTLVVLQPPPYGACCLGQSCTPDVSADDCATLGGLYVGDGSVCDPNPCSGACCVNEVCVANTTEAECSAQSGTWYVSEDCGTFACPGPEYCEAFCGLPDPYIGRVQLNTLDNASGAVGYEDFTPLSTALEVGTDYPLVVTAMPAYSSNYCTAWVDWNRDGDFFDDGETFPLTLDPGPPTGPFFGTITPPPGTTLGNKRLRIALTWSLPPEPCGELGYGYGEVEDYTIIVGEDCNHNGVLDAVDIATGFSQDCQPDGIPDECQLGTVPNLLRWDDDSSEGGVGLTTGGALAWVNHFTVAGSRSIQAVQTCFGNTATPGASGVTPSSSFGVYVWSDPNGDGSPLDAQLLAQAVGTVEAGSIDTDVFQSVPISTEVNGSFFVGVSCEHAAGTYPAPLDQTAPQHNSWVTHNSVPYNPTVWDPTKTFKLEDVDLAGNWLLRAELVFIAPPNDCNLNSIPDECDIAAGTSQDANGNGVPDECELLPGDLNCDGEVGFGDINPFVLALTNPAAWQAQYPDCNLLNGDINGDSQVDLADINPFVALLTGR